MRTTLGPVAVILTAAMGLAAGLAGGATALAQGGGTSPEALLQQTLRTGDSTIPKEGAGEQFG